MKRFIGLFVVSAVLLFCMGCSLGTQLPEGFDEEIVIERAKHVVSVINTRDYEAIIQLLAEDLQGAITPSELSDAWDPKLSAIGDFKDFRNIATLANKNPETLESYATVILRCRYEKGSAVFTLSFCIDMQLIGLYMR